MVAIFFHRILLAAVKDYFNRIHRIVLKSYLFIQIHRRSYIF